MNNEHPPDEILRNYLNGKVPAPEAGPIEAHLGACEGCAARLEALASDGDSFQKRLRDAALNGDPDQSGLLGDRFSLDRDWGDPAIGTLIAGRYKVGQALGEGGMGTVYLAEQVQPVRRQVALKLIRAGMDSRQILARFESERQALAIMDHPHIARVLDAGTTATGHPFFVMELVRGIPLTEFCDQHRLDPPTRLNLFQQICGAVQHAHQKGVIHRDLKPSNILVEDHDGTPVPKVIDFGLAKATGGLNLAEQSVFTALGTIAGTPQYMAPEQATFNSVDVDTRADIYALGVVLYELLTGSTPIRRELIQRVALDEMLRVIREDEPPTPSSRLIMSEALPSVAAVRKVEPIRLGRFVRGDLDWIVMKALAKERTRRYDSAMGLANDIERFLNHEPVIAGPPTARYRVAKYIRRHRGQVVAVALVILALIGGVVGTTLGYFEARRQEAEARHQKDLAVKWAEREQQARLDAQQEKTLAEANEQRALSAADGETQAKESAEAVLGFVEDRIFAAARPRGQAGGLGFDVTLADAIMAALPTIERDFATKPLIEARLRRTVGQSFLYLGKPDLAHDLFATAQALNTKHLGADHSETLASMDGLAFSYSKLGQHAEALKLRERTLALRRAKLGPDDAATLTSMNNLANTYSLLGRRDEALELREATLLGRQKKLGPVHADTLTSMNNLATSYNNLGRHVEAIRLLERTLTVRKIKLGPVHPDTLTSMNDLAESYNRVGRRDEALKLREATLAVQRIELGRDHPDTLRTMQHLAQTYTDLKRPADALQLREEILVQRQAKFAPDHPNRLASMSEIASSYTDLGRYTEALKLRLELLVQRQAKFTPDHPDRLASMSEIASSYTDLGRYTEALELRKEILVQRQARFALDHPDTLTSMSEIARSYADLGRHAEALKLREEVLAGRRARLEPNHADTLASMNDLANTYYSVNRFADARTLFGEALAGRRAKLGLHDPTTLDTMRRLGGTNAVLGRHAEALKLREEVVAIQQAPLGSDTPEITDDMLNLSLTLEAVGRTAESVPFLDKCSAACPGGTATSLRVAALWAWFGRPTEFAAVRRRVLAFAQTSDDAITLERAAKLSSILPSTDRAELDAALTLARRANTPGDQPPLRFHRRLALGMAAYRAGDDSTCAEALRDAERANRAIPLVWNAAALFRAMSLHRCGQVDEARRLAAEVTARMTPLPTDGNNPLLGNDSYDELVVWLAYKEAKALIGGVSPPSAPIPVAK